MPRVEYHPVFERQMGPLWHNTALIDITAEISALLVALEHHGHVIEGYADEDPSHPIVTSRYQMFALRRTPATIHTPYADKPPIIRIPYVWFRGSDDQELAVVMLMGDKSATGNQWYPQRVNNIETRLIPDWERNNPGHRAIIRKTR